MISAVKVFTAKFSFYIQQILNKRLKHFISVAKILESHLGAEKVFNGHRFCDLVSKLGQEFSDRFYGFEKLEPAETFIANLFLDVDISELSGQMTELFSVGPLEMDIINLQNDVHLKFQQDSQHFWSLVEPDNYKNLTWIHVKDKALWFNLCNANLLTDRHCATHEHYKKMVDL